MSTFTGLRISRFFLSLRTSALFPFYVLKPAEVFPPFFLLQLLAISGKCFASLSHFIKQIPTIRRLMNELPYPVRGMFLSISPCYSFARVGVVDERVPQTWKNKNEFGAFFD